MTLTLGEKRRREGLNVCMNDEFNLLHHVGVVVKKVRAAAAAFNLWGRGAGVFVSDKSFISTWLGGALNFLNFTTANVEQFLK